MVNQCEGKTLKSRRYKACKTAGFLLDLNELINSFKLKSGGYYV
jgi:hypothetical protein